MGPGRYAANVSITCRSEIPPGRHLGSLHNSERPKGNKNNPPGGINYTDVNYFQNPPLFIFFCNKCRPILKGKKKKMLLDGTNYTEWLRQRQPPRIAF